MFISKHAIFLEKEFLLSEDNGSKLDLEEVQETNIDIDQLNNLELVTIETVEPSDT